MAKGDSPPYYHRRLELPAAIDGELANVEDLIIAYALDIPYENQHVGQEVH